MTQFSRRGALGLLGGAAALPVLGTPALASTKIKVGALNFTSHAASFVAFERGYFAEAGLDVEFEFFQAAQPMAVAIASGDADYAVTAISGGLISLAEKGATKVIGGALSEEKGIDGQKILVSDAAYQAGITTPKALEGKKFGITQAGSSFHYMGAKMAAAEGIGLEYVPLQKVGAVIGALKSGQIDAWSIVPHIAKPLAGSGAVHIVGDVADYIPDYQVTTVFTSANNAANDRAKTEAFLAAFSKGAADFNAALVDKTAGEDAAEAMIQLIHKYVYADKPYDAAKPGIVNGAMRINADAALNVTSVQDQLDWFKSEGLVKDSVTTDMLVDPSYVATM
ncbi:ABC transporter substrate-binding protein [Thalassovita sp.]|uniref:ABC transporter substrate-binding protein n=1 Tax=Thalassovita sp. TaxID=1979401 RepID=UPI0029DE5F92|nr:ABC transporter substrate-binding protein [Thalassovita sp.]